MRPQTLARVFAANFLPNLSAIAYPKSCHVGSDHNDSRDHSGAMSSAFTLSATSVGVARTKPPTGASRRGRVATVTRAACPGDDDAPVPTPVSAPGRREALLSAAALAAVSPATRANAAEPLKESFYDYTVSQYGKPFDLSAFKGDVTEIGRAHV